MANVPLLFIAYQFPPVAGGGVHRMMEFVQGLPAHEIEPIVLTVDIHRRDRTKQMLDKERLEDIAADLRVVRTPTNEPRRLKKWLESNLSERFYSYLRVLCFPWLNSHFATWSLTSFLTARRLVRKHEIKVIFTTSPPHSTLLLGMMLKLFCGVRWIADLRDPYTDGYQWHWPSKGHWYLSRAFERLALGYCDKVIVNTPEVKRLYLRRELVTEQQIEVITSGISV